MSFLGLEKIRLLIPEAAKEFIICRTEEEYQRHVKLGWLTLYYPQLGEQAGIYANLWILYWEVGSQSAGYCGASSENHNMVT